MYFKSSHKRFALFIDMNKPPFVMQMAAYIGNGKDYD